MSQIAKLDQEIKKLEKKEAPTKADIAKIRSLQKDLKNLYITNKASLVKFEKTNTRYLAFLQSTGGFHKLIGRSALFYSLEIAPRLNLKVRLQPDGDYLDRSEEGVVSIRNLEKLAEKLKVLGIELVEDKSTKDITFFKLPWTYSAEDIERLTTETQLQLDQFNQIVLPRVSYPTLYTAILEMTKTVYENVRKMQNSIAGEILGADFLKMAIRIEQEYLELANGQSPEQETLRKILKELLWMKNRAKIIADLSVWPAKTCVRLGQYLQKIEEIIHYELGRG